MFFKFCLMAACLSLLKHASGFNVYKVSRAPTRASPFSDALLSPLGLGMLRSSDMLFPSLMWPTVTRAREIDRNTNSNVLPVDVRETDTKWEIFAELPGFDRSELQVLMEEDTITIKATKTEKLAATDKESTQNPVEQEATIWHLKERSSALSSLEVERTFKLPSEVDYGQITSLFKNGLLTVTIPKKTAEKKACRTIEIKT